MYYASVFYPEETNTVIHSVDNLVLFHFQIGMENIVKNGLSGIKAAICLVISQNDVCLTVFIFTE